MAIVSSSEERVVDVFEGLTAEAMRKSWEEAKLSGALFIPDAIVIKGRSVGMSTLAAMLWKRLTKRQKKRVFMKRLFSHRHNLLRGALASWAGVPSVVIRWDVPRR